MHAQLETILFRYWWCPTRTKDTVVNTPPYVKCLINIVFDGIWLIIWILLMFMIFAYSSNALIVSLLGMHAHDHLDPEQCPYFPLLLACPKSLIVTCNLRNQRCWSASCNPLWSPWCDVHVHEPQWKHWSIQKMCEKKNEAIIQSTFIWWCMDKLFWTYYWQFGMWSFPLSWIIIHP
jgi:hypothetical protein